MEPILRLIEEALSFTTLTVHKLFKLTLTIIKQWFKNWLKNISAIPENEKENLGFTIKELYENGNYKLIQGVFNTQTEEVVDGQQFEAQTLDEELEKAHRNDKLVIYT